MTKATSPMDVYMEGITVPENDENPVYMADSADWTAIDWDIPERPADVEQAQAELATELHCLHLSLVSTLGDIIADEPDLDMKRLATVLSQAHMRNADAWGRYLMASGGDTHISDTVLDHGADIAADDPVCQMTSVALSGILAATLHRYLDAENTVFSQILHREAQQGAKNLELCERYLARWMEDRTPEEQQSVSAWIETCVDWFNQYADQYSDLLSAANIDGEAAADAYRENAEAFYERIQTGTDMADGQTVRIRSSTSE